MSRSRPFADDATVFASADRLWRDLNADDWLEAFGHHPRIGDRIPTVEAAEDVASTRDHLARTEQAGMDSAVDDVRARIERGNREYERRFGHVFLICATGRSADEMLASLEERLEHDAATELRIAVGEQAKITRLRLNKLANT